MSKFLDVLTAYLPRLEQPSTWRGLVALVTAAGISVAPDKAEAIGTLGAALFGVIGVFISDSPVQPPEQK